MYESDKRRVTKNITAAEPTLSGTEWEVSIRSVVVESRLQWIPDERRAAHTREPALLSSVSSVMACDAAPQQSAMGASTVAVDVPSAKWAITRYRHVSR